MLSFSDCSSGRARGEGREKTLLHFAGRAGDHNDRAMAGSPALAAELARRLGVAPVVVGTPRPALSVGWEHELEEAMPELLAMSVQMDRVFARGCVPVVALSRCAVALATLPVVAAQRSDAVVVWFDAHADLNIPATTETGYLGGMALSGPLGLWPSGLGAGLSSENAVLVGARAIDPPEQALIDAGAVRLIRIGPDMADELRDVVSGRPVYVHVDCDVLEPGIVPTDYHVPDGLTLADLGAMAEVLAGSEVVGVEIGELERAARPQATRAHADRLLDALRPVVR